VNETAVTQRLAHLHLRTGLPLLARVELETLAGRGDLSGPALADLAEARWRGGDLSAAGEAAQAHLDQGGDEVLAEVVVVEALAAAGRQRDARRLALRVLARPDVDEAAVEAVFAGHPRSAAWPERAEPAEAPGTAAPAATPSRVARPVRSAPGPSDDIASAEAAVSRGDALGAAGLLAVALREEPALAAMILSLAERALAVAGRTGPAVATLQLVRGDALRLLGRANEASAAFQGSRRALVDAAPREEPT
jgi:hypothetical protein